jgi:hypothetical protein
VIFSLIASFTVSLLGAAACYWAAGPTLGLFFGSLVLVALITPPLMTTAPDWRSRALTFACILVPHLIAWFIAYQRSSIRFNELLNSAIVLISFAAAIAGIALLGNVVTRGRIRGGASGAIRLGVVAISAITTIVALASLTWPIWMSKTWNGSDSSAAVDRYLRLNAAMVINGQLLPATGPWTEQSIAYHLTDLNQDVPYTMPRRILASAFMHAGIAALCIVVVALIERKKNARLRL